MSTNTTVSMLHYAHVLNSIFSETRTSGLFRVPEPNIYHIRWLIFSLFLFLQGNSFIFVRYSCWSKPPTTLQPSRPPCSMHVPLSFSADKPDTQVWSMPLNVPAECVISYHSARYLYAILIHMLSIFLCFSIRYTCQLYLYGGTIIWYSYICTILSFTDIYLLFYRWARQRAPKWSSLVSEQLRIILSMRFCCWNSDNLS